MNRLASQAFSPWFDLLAGLTVGWQMALTAVPLTVFALLVFRYASNQAGILAAKNRVKAYLLEAWLFRDDLAVTLAANGRVLLSSLRYLGHSLFPLAVMVVPVALLLVQVEARFAWRALLPGEAAILAISLAPETSLREPGLDLPDGLLQEIPVLRVAAREGAGPRAYWRLRAGEPGIHEARIHVADVALTRRVVVSAPTVKGIAPGGAPTGLAAIPARGDVVVGAASAAISGPPAAIIPGLYPPISPVVYRANDWRTLGSPAEPALDPAGPVLAIALDYPRARGEFGGLSSASWLLVGLTLLLGLLLRRFFGVTF